MSFHRFLKDNRGAFIDHRMPASAGPGVARELDDTPETYTRRTGGGLLRRSRSAQTAVLRRRYRHVRPAWAPMPFSDPLPYEDPMERARQWNS